MAKLGEEVKKELPDEGPGGGFRIDGKEAGRC